jgi:hypothetical protein
MKVFRMEDLPDGQDHLPHTELSSLRTKLRNVMGAIGTTKEATWRSYARYLEDFFSWLHFNRPKCFRRMPVRSLGDTGQESV